MPLGEKIPGKNAQKTPYPQSVEDENSLRGSDQGKAEKARMSAAAWQLSAQ
jgi:hypothetical protein